MAIFAFSSLFVKPRRPGAFPLGEIAASSGAMQEYLVRQSC